MPIARLLAIQSYIGTYYQPMKDGEPVLCRRERARAGLTAKLAHNHELRAFCAEPAELFAHALDFGFIEQWSDPHPMH